MMAMDALMSGWREIIEVEACTVELEAGSPSNIKAHNLNIFFAGLDAGSPRGISEMTPKMTTTILRGRSFV